VTVQELLIALYNGLSRLGCGMAGIYYEESSADLPFSHIGCAKTRNRENSQLADPRMPY